MIKEYAKPINSFEKLIGYEFKDKSLIIQAWTHTSYANEYNSVNKNKIEHYERLEFLGDAVLELIIVQYLYEKYPKHNEGKLTYIKQAVVCEPYLAKCSKEYGLNKYILLGRGEELEKGRQKDTIIADVVEAILGAIYLDGGFTNAKEFVNKFILNDFDNKQLFFNSKNILQEYSQKIYKKLPEYFCIKESGESHRKIYEVVVRLNEKEMGYGKATSMKAAEQQAAYEALKKINEK
ncbi:MAG: ribonuclease III [Lachnospira sp.]|nr:ribonuclease III [Lachnospira sp.]